MLIVVPSGVMPTAVMLKVLVNFTNCESIGERRHVKFLSKVAPQVVKGTIGTFLKIFGSSTVVENSTTDPEVKGSILAASRHQKKLVLVKSWSNF